MVASRAPPLPLDEHHSAVACFYALFSILQKPLTQFLIERARASIEMGKAAPRTKLEILRDGPDTLPEVVEDVKALLQVHNQGFYSPNVSTSVFVKGLEAVERLLGAIGANKYAYEQAISFKWQLLWTDGNQSQDEGVAEMKEDVTKHQAEQEESVNPASSPPTVSPPGTSVEPQGVVRSRAARQKVHSEQNGARMRKWLIGQALRIMDSHAYENDEQIEFGRREVVRLLTEALRFAKNIQQHSDIFLMRSECRLMFGEFEEAAEDARAALEPRRFRSLDVIRRILNVFMLI